MSKTVASPKALPVDLSLKNLIVVGLLAAVLALGLFLRCYNLNFPSIGYHNMKENEYLSMAQEMKHTGDYVTRRIYFYNAFEPDPQMNLYPQPPIVSYQILAAWKLFGENLWSARLVNALFGVASIFVIFVMGCVLFGNRWRALACAFFLACMPLAVFFSRNLQPESPAFFFMLLGQCLYLTFIRSRRRFFLVVGGIAFVVAWAYKFSFLIGIVPILFCLPVRDLCKNTKSLVSFAVSALAPYVIIVVVIGWLKAIGQWSFMPEHTTEHIKLFWIFTAEYWKAHARTIWWYIKGENYTLVFVALALLGIVIAFVRRRGMLYRYLIGTCCAIVPYCMVFSFHITQHNYYQMPFVGFVCIASIAALSAAAEAIGRFLKKDIFLVLVAVALGTASPLVYGSIQRMHGTVFLGTDVAGESLAEFTKPGERVFILTYAQGYAIARYAGRFAARYFGWPKDYDDFLEKEKRFNVRYICFYPAEFSVNLQQTDAKLFEYIRSNYHVKEAGLVDEGGQQRISYVILERGEGSSPETFLKQFSGRTELRSFYTVVGNHLGFYTIRSLSAEEQALLQQRQSQLAAEAPTDTQANRQPTAAP